MSALLSPEEKRLRRWERTRLLAFLVSGGRLTSEEMPAGARAWVRVTRSGSPFSDRAAKRLRTRGGFTYRGIRFDLDGDSTSLCVICEAPDEAL